MIELMLKNEEGWMALERMLVYNEKEMWVREREKGENKCDRCANENKKREIISKSGTKKRTWMTEDQIK